MANNDEEFERDTAYYALTVVVSAIGFGIYMQSLWHGVALALLAGFPLLFIGLLFIGLKADELLGVEHGYGW